MCASRRTARNRVQAGRKGRGTWKRSKSVQSSSSSSSSSACLAALSSISTKPCTSHAMLDRRLQTACTEQARAVATLAPRSSKEPLRSTEAIPHGAPPEHRALQPSAARRAGAKGRRCAGACGHGRARAEPRPPRCRVGRAALRRAGATLGPAGRAQQPCHRHTRSDTFHTSVSMAGRQQPRGAPGDSAPWAASSGSGDAPNRCVHTQHPRPPPAKARAVAPRAYCVRGEDAQCLRLQEFEE